MLVWVHQNAFKPTENGTCGYFQLCLSGLTDLTSEITVGDRDRAMFVLGRTLGVDEQSAALS